MKINMKGYEEWKENASKEKVEISKVDLIKVCGRIAGAAVEPKNEVEGAVAASIKVDRIVNELFQDEGEE